MLRDAFEESSIPFRVDLFSWDEVPEEFKDNIERECLVLQDIKKCVSFITINSRDNVSLIGIHKIGYAPVNCCYKSCRMG